MDCVGGEINVIVGLQCEIYKLVRLLGLSK